MEPFLVILLIVAAMLVALVWVAVVVLVTLIRAAAWGVKLPLRALRTLSRAGERPSVSTGPMQCGNEKCCAPLPATARYCPRCGTGVTTVVDLPAPACRNGITLRARVA